jgi:hypothetical protein
MLIMLMIFVGGGDWQPIAPIVTVQDGVIIGNTLPMWGTMCKAEAVRGGPDMSYPISYSVGVGERVRLHEPSNPDGTWVSIGAAQWVPINSLCWNDAR